MTQVRSASRPTWIDFSSAIWFQAKAIMLRMKRVVHAACPHDCPDACGVLITVENGRATKIQGDPAHPVTRGFLCAKVANYLERVYSPDRVLYPMRRRAGVAKGAGKRNVEDFERITWEQALDEIFHRVTDIAATFRAYATMP